MKTASTLAVLIAMFIALPAFGQKSTRADFNEFAKTMQGRWVGDVTWITDWPGWGKKGDKITCYAENKIAEDGNAVILRFYGGSGSGTGITVFDAGSKQIKETFVSSGGTVWTTVFFKKDGKWVNIQSGSNADGSKVEAKNMLSISDNGNKHTWTGTTKIGGKNVDELNDVWRRVSK